MIKTLAKVLAGLLGLFVILAIAGIVAFKFLADPERVKAEVIQLVADQTGRELSIDGDLRLSFVPWLGFEVGGVRLSNAKGFGDGPFATLQSAEARVRLWPLFRKQIEVGTLAVTGLEMDLVTARSGATNWDDLVASNDSAPTDGEAPGGFSAQGVANIRIENANIHYRDLASGDEYRLRNANLSAGPLTPGKPFDVSAGFDMDVDSDLSAEVAAATTLETDMESGVYRTGPVKADVIFSGTSIGKTPLPATVRLDSLTLDAEAETMVIQGVSARTLDTEIVLAKVDGSDVFGDSVFKGPLVIESFSPRTFMRGFDIAVPETADGSVLKKASLSAQMQQSKDRFSLQNIQARVDDSTISGQFAYTSIKRDSMRFDLDIDAIDADRYLPPAGAQSESTAAAMDEEPLPVELLKALDINGTVRIGSLKFAGIQSSDVRATVKAANGELRINPSQARLYGGQYSGDIRLTTRGDTVTLSMDEQVSGLQAGALSGDLFDSERLSGAADATVRLTGTGKTLGAMRRTLSGDLSFKFADGYIDGIDLWYEIQRAKAVFGKAATPQRTGPVRTEYSDMRGTAVVKDGILRNDDFAAELPFLRVAGAGEINLVNATVDYRVNALVLKKPEVLAEEQVADLVGARIPVRISGNLASPSVAPDIEAWVRSKAEDKINQKKDELLGKLLGTSKSSEPEAAAADQPAEAPKDTEEALKQDVEDKLKNKLKGLLGGGKDDG